MKYYLLIILICVFQIDEVEHFSFVLLHYKLPFYTFLFKLSCLLYILKILGIHHLSVKYVANNFSWSI